VLLVAAVLFFWQLGGHDLWTPDEPYFAEGAREMVVDGEWAVPHINGRISTDKPPLFFWTIAVPSLVLGEVSPWTARLPSALAGLITVLLVIRLGLRFAGPRTAALAGLMLCTTYMFWQKSRWSQIDALLCCLIWIALSAFEAYRAGDARGRSAGLVFFAAVALAVLAKGPVGLLLPLGIVIVTLAVDRDLASLKRFAPLAGPAVFAALMAAWIVFATVDTGGEYSVWGALQEHFIDRGMHGMHHAQPPWYYLEALPPNVLPWIGILPGALFFAFRRRLPADRFLLAAALFVLVFFSISTEKRVLYVLPALPAFALLAANLISALCGWGESPQPERPVHRRWATTGHGLVAFGMGAVGVALPFVAEDVDNVPAGIAVALGGLLLAGGAAALLVAARGRALAATFALAATIGVFYLTAVSLVYPRFEPEKSARAFSMQLKEAAGPSYEQGRPVLTYDLSNLPEAFAFYTDGLYTREAEDVAELAEHLGRPEQVFAVMNANAVDAMPDPLVDRLRLVASTHLSRRDVLLVTNRAHPGGEPLPTGR
jgi:4-amino-4-deoxy-L-arabinose transferase-like glycosyltransferase